MRDLICQREWYSPVEDSQAGYQAADAAGLFVVHIGKSGPIDNHSVTTVRELNEVPGLLFSSA